MEDEASQARDIVYARLSFPVLHNHPTPLPVLLHTNMSSDAPDSMLSGSYAYTDTLKGVYYGPGCVAAALSKLLATLGATMALVVTGRSLHEKTDVVRRVEVILREHGAYSATFWEIGEHTPVAGIKSGVQALVGAAADVVTGPCAMAASDIAMASAAQPFTTKDREDEEVVRQNRRKAPTAPPLDARDAYYHDAISRKRSLGGSMAVPMGSAYSEPRASSSHHHTGSGPYHPAAPVVHPQCYAYERGFREGRGRGSNHGHSSSYGYGTDLATFAPAVKINRALACTARAPALLYDVVHAPAHNILASPVLPAGSRSRTRSPPSSA
ncbi:hypothetical protein DFH11DRAFT_1765457 [Phellopilus nigrolimitatus]|nr:hypothetical protein DFH11DRAFT_1765457 [Phellopilus nigrolimitatus]